MKMVVWFGFVLGAASVAGKVFFSKPGQKAILECGVTTQPKALNWRREGDLIIGQDRNGLPRKVKNDFGVVPRSTLRSSTLQISNVQEEDAGKFSCDADGISHEHTFVVVSVSANPTGEPEVGSKVTLKCHVSGLTPVPGVKWLGPNRNNKPSQEAEIDSVAVSDKGTWTCVITLNEQTFTDTLDLKVKEFIKTTAPPPTQRPKERPKSSCPNCGIQQPAVNQLHWWVWVAVGVGGVVVVLLIVCVVVLCKQIRRRRKRRKMMKRGEFLMGPKKYCQCSSPTAAARPQQGRRKKKPTALPV